MVGSTEKTASQASLKNLRGRIPFHSMLVAIYVWLLPYATNLNELSFSSVIIAAVIAIATATVLLSLLWIVLGDGRAAGIISTLLIVCLVYYGHVFDSADDLMDGSLRNKIFMPIWLGLFLTPIILTLFHRLNLEKVTKALNIGALVLVLIPLSSIVLNVGNEIRRDLAKAAPSFVGQLSPSSTSLNTTEYPDIYYIIFDRYADNRTLNDVYKYDNSKFLNNLREHGFYVADRSRANYGRTAHSLASSLNLIHLTYLSQFMGSDSRDWKPIYALLQDHEVGRFLKAHGYRYVHLGSWWQPTSNNVLADENFGGSVSLPWAARSLNEFEWLLVEPMLPTRFFNLALGLRQYDGRRQQYVRVRQIFNKLLFLQRQAEPLFVFAHILVPHDPYVFFQDGRYKTRAEADTMTRDKNYVDQVVYANRMIEELVHKLLGNEPQPIIIIQSDEGPFPTRYAENPERFEWREATTEELRQKFRILNAIFLPGKDYEDFYEDITPANTFRLIFNKFFIQNLPLLPDISYANFSDHDIYSFFVVSAVTK